MACDVCGKTGTHLTDLLDGYQSAEIRAICPECESVINKRSSVLHSWAQNVRRALLKRFMTERRESFTKGAKP